MSVHVGCTLALRRPLDVHVHVSPGLPEERKVGGSTPAALRYLHATEGRDHEIANALSSLAASEED
jgi:hypothetical protein